MCFATVGQALAPREGAVAELEVRLREERERLTRELRPLSLPGSGRRGTIGYHEMDRLRGVHRRLRLVDQLIAELPRADPRWLGAGRAGFGSVVFTRETGTRRERAYRLVCGEPDRLDASQLSLASPLGRALVHSRAGDEIVVDEPPALRHLRVVSVTTLPQALGMAGPAGQPTLPAPAPAGAPGCVPPRSLRSPPPL